MILVQYLLKYVLDRFGSLPNFAINSICQLYGRLTKISWLDGVDDSFPFQEPVEKIMELLKVCLQGRSVRISEV